MYEVIVMDGKLLINSPYAAIGEIIEKNGEI